MWGWGEDKRRATLLLRGLAFASVEGFDLGAALIAPDVRGWQTRAIAALRRVLGL